MADAIEAPAEQDKPIDSPEAPETDKPTGEESFTDFDTSQIPEDADRDWFEQKYNELRSGFTKKTQEFGETRQEAEQLRQLRDALANPQVAPAVLAQLGYTEKQVLEMFGYQAEEEESPELIDPDERIGRLEQTLAQKEQAEQAERQEAAVTDYIAGEIEALEADFKKKNSRDFTLEEQQLLDAYARQFAKDTATGRVPDVQGAYGLLTGALSSHQKALLDPKRDVPRVPGNGKSASRTVDLSKESQEERRERMAQAVDAARASSA